MTQLLQNRATLVCRPGNPIVGWTFSRGFRTVNTVFETPGPGDPKPGQAVDQGGSGAWSEG
jgi:hypothetical protein